MIQLLITELPNQRTGQRKDFVYVIKENDTTVITGTIDDHNTELHPIVLLERTIEDALVELHMNRNGR